MKIQVDVDIPQYLVDRVVTLVKDFYGTVPTNEQLVEFFKQDIEQVYMIAPNYLTDAVESFFYVEETN